MRQNRMTEDGKTLSDDMVNMIEATEPFRSKDF